MKMLNDMWDAVDGKKAYIVALATVVYAVLGALLGFIPMQHAIELILGALGLGALRHAM